MTGFDLRAHMEPDINVLLVRRRTLVKKVRHPLLLNLRDYNLL